MQKKTNVEIVGVVYTYNKTYVQEKESKIENKKAIKIDEAKTYEKALGF